MFQGYALFHGYRLRFWCMTALVLIAAQADAQLFSPPPRPDQIVVDATNVLAQSVAMPSGLPQSMLPSAQGIVIVPNMVRGAFVIGAQFGRGVLLMRGPGGAWQAPRMVTITGGSLGYQVGVQSTDLILIFRTPQSVANLLRGTLKVGVDASAAAGPVGRQASAATDLPLQAEILSYSRHAAHSWECRLTVRWSQWIRPPMRPTISRQERSRRRPRS